jgi:hypothetical protein
MVMVSRQAKVQVSNPPPRRRLAQRERHVLGPASGWAVTAHFGPGGTRWAGSGPCLRVIAVNPRRGTGSSPDRRLELLERAIEQTAEGGPCVYFTSAGFIGCATPAGDQTKDFFWPGDLDVSDLDRRLGDLASQLPADTRLGVGVEASDTDQKIWWYSGCRIARSPEIVRAETQMQDRLVEIGGFRLLAFVCGELWNGGSGFDITRDTVGVDVVLDSAHGSVNRVWDRAANPRRRWAFQRTFRHVGEVCGGMLAQAHEADAGHGYVRRQDNWVVYKDELPFPDVEVIEL